MRSLPAAEGQSRLFLLYPDTCCSLIRCVQCDERKPSCSGCQRKKRACTYASAEVSKMMHSLPGNQWIDSKKEQLDSSRWFYLTLITAQQSVGAKALGPTEERLDKTYANSPDWPLIDLRTSLAARWIHMIGRKPPESCSFDVLGPMYRTLPPRLGESQLVSLAATYAMDSYSAFKTWSCRNNDNERTLACRSGQKAMKAARDAVHNVLAKPSGVVETDLLIANRLLFLAEVSYNLPSRSDD